MIRIYENILYKSLNTAQFYWQKRNLPTYRSAFFQNFVLNKSKLILSKWLSNTYANLKKRRSSCIVFNLTFKTLPWLHIPLIIRHKYKHMNKHTFVWKLIFLYLVDFICKYFLHYVEGEVQEDTGR